MYTSFTAALLAVTVSAGSHWIYEPQGFASSPTQVFSKLELRDDWVKRDAEGSNNLSLLLSDLNQKLGQVVTDRNGLVELTTVPASLPLRAIPQDISYAFLRGINSFDIFWQDSTAA